MLSFNSKGRKWAAAVANTLLALGVCCPAVAQGVSAHGTGAHAAPQRLSTADRDALKRALAAEDAGRTDNAERSLLNLVKRNPENFDVVESVGLLYAGEEKFGAAFPYLEKATRIDAASALAYANLGAVELKLNRNQEAVKALQKSAALDPKNGETLSNLGLALMQTNQPKQAADAFGRAAAGGGDNADLLYNWGVALLSAGDAARATEVLLRVPQGDTSAPLQGLLGDAFERQQKFKEAVDHYQAAVKLDPSEANIYALGVEFLRHWTFEPAIKIFDYGLSRYPQTARLQAGRGIAKYANNNFAEAAQIFSDLLGKDPNNGLYAQILAHSCKLSPDSIPACGTLVDFAERNPANAEAATYAATSILRRPPDEHNLESAEKLLRNAIAADPKLADAYFQLGLLEQLRSQWQESEGTLERCLALNPELSKAHYRLALAYSHTGQKDKAKEEFALHQKYSQQEKDELNARLQEVTTFIVKDGEQGSGNRDQSTGIRQQGSEIR